MSQRFFADLLPVLAGRAKHAAIGRLGFANVPLRRYLAEMFDRPYGEQGAFLADPSFEATFGWMKADQRMADLSGNLLSASLVQAMDDPPKELVKDYRFPQDQYPYRHQLEAWRILAQPKPQSIVVASGTGSGKTECFMVPILDRMARLREEKQGQLVGVRALFLYPLNALINSQRKKVSEMGSGVVVGRVWYSQEYAIWLETRDHWTPRKKKTAKPHFLKSGFEDPEPQADIKDIIKQWYKL